MKRARGPVVVLGAAAAAALLAAVAGAGRGEDARVVGCTAVQFNKPAEDDPTAILVRAWSDGRVECLPVRAGSEELLPMPGAAWKPMR